MFVNKLYIEMTSPVDRTPKNTEKILEENVSTRKMPNVNKLKILLPCTVVIYCI